MQAFAPTPYLPDPISTLPFPNQEIKLFSTAFERESYDTLSVLFSILVSLEFLEKAYVRDTLPFEIYGDRCKRLLGQYKSIMDGGLPKIDDPVGRDGRGRGGGDGGGIDEFCERWKVSYPLALARVREGRPAGHVLDLPVSTNHVSDAPPFPDHQRDRERERERTRAASKSAARVAEIVQNFITLMDALKLNFRAKDQLHPLLSDLMNSLTHAYPFSHDNHAHGTGTNGGEEGNDGDAYEDEEGSGGGEELEGKGRIVKWLIRINQMKASEEIDEDEVRELFFDVEGLYNSYLKTL